GEGECLPVLKGFTVALLTPPLALFSFLRASDFLERAFDNLELAHPNGRRMTALRTLGGRAINEEALLALPNGNVGSFAARALFAILQRPLAIVVGQAVLDAVACMIEDDGLGLPLTGPKRAADLLEIEGEGLSRAEQDSRLDRWNVEAFAE